MLKRSSQLRPLSFILSLGILWQKSRTGKTAKDGEMLFDKDC